MADSGYMNMTVEVLRRELRRRNLPAYGRKAEMVRGSAICFMRTPFEVSHLIIFYFCDSVRR